MEDQIFVINVTVDHPDKTRVNTEFKAPVSCLDIEQVMDLLKSQTAVKGSYQAVASSSRIMGTSTKPNDLVISQNS